MPPWTPDPNSFVLVVSNRLYSKLWDEMAQYQNRTIGDFELCKHIAELGLPVDDMKYRMTTIEVDPALKEHEWKRRPLRTPTEAVNRGC
jgi:hypothetical protein